MNKNSRKIIFISCIIIGIVVILMIILSTFGEKLIVKEVVLEDTLNYTINEKGEKVNISESISKLKEINEVKIENTKIVSKDGASKLNSKVTNNSVQKEGLRYKITFFDSKGNVMIEATGYVGTLKEFETKYMDAYVTIDVSNAKDIDFQIIE